MRNVSGSVTGDLEKCCERCGVGFMAKRATAKFCSNACRQAAYAGRPVVDLERKCLVCDRSIGHRRADAIYCDDQCRSMGGRWVREAIRAIEANTRTAEHSPVPHWDFFNAYADTLKSD